MAIPQDPITVALHSLAAHSDDATPDHDESHPRRHRRRGRLPRNEITLNLTAMLDMAFQLLIFFILTANFAANEGVLAANLPQGGGGASTADPGTLPTSVPADIRLIAVGSGELLGDVEIRLDDQRMPSFQALTNALAQREEAIDDPNAPAGSPGSTKLRQSPVIIHAQGNVAWQHVVNAFNAAVRARYANVAFAQTEEGR